MTELISIIVPVYNAEKTLDKCITSLVNQSYRFIEIILVNDGSTDRSADICRNYSNQYKNIKVINQLNAGPSSARNNGIAITQGKYIQFVDSDDFIDENMCEILIGTMLRNKSELVVSGYKILKNSNIIQHVKRKLEVNIIKELSNEFSDLYTKNLINPPWNKLYIKENIINNFDEKLNLGEDLIFNLDYMKNVKKICFIDDCLYNYIEDMPNSLTKKYRPDTFFNSIKIYNYVNDFCSQLLNNKFYEKGTNSVLLLNSFGSIQGLVYNSSLTPKEKIRNIKSWINTSEVLTASKNNDLNNFQSRVLIKFIKSNSSLSIYLFFQIKKTLSLLMLKRS